MISIRSVMLGKVCFSCDVIPAGIEIVAPPETITMLVPAGRALLVTEGQAVLSGEPLCEGAVHGVYSSIYGTVQQIVPWDGGNAASFKAVRIKSEGKGTGSGRCHKLFEPVKDILSLQPDILLQRYRLCGFKLPENAGPVLVTMLDEDISRTANRWYFEKDFDRVLLGLTIIKKIFTGSNMVIAVPDSCSAEKKRLCAVAGRVISVPPKYPDVLCSSIMKRDALMKNAAGVSVIDSKRLISLVASLESGCAATAIPVSVKYGMRGKSRLYLVTSGMTVGDLLASVGIVVTQGTQIVVGGEMSGISAATLLQPLMPGNDSVTVLPPESVARSENGQCVNCGRCSRVCPVGLRVDLIGKCVERDRVEEAVRLGIHGCTGCGLCTSVCIVRRPLTHLLAFGKQAYPVTGSVVKG